MIKQDSPERYEQVIAFLGTNLPQPVERDDDGEGSIRFTAGDPPEVVVLLTPTSVIVAEFTGEWESPLTFVAKPRRVASTLTGFCDATTITDVGPRCIAPSGARLTQAE